MFENSLNYDNIDAIIAELQNQLNYSNQEKYSGSINLPVDNNPNIPGTILTIITCIYCENQA